MRLQKLVAAMAISGALGSGLANALGLGEVRLNSALNQPLDAEIELLQVRELTRNEILPNLAGRADFQRAGLDRPFSLTGLKFKTMLREDGTGYIHVTSDQVVREPFLNFLLEVHWPSGRLLREYTMLLDPPAFSQQPAAPVRPAATQNYNGGVPTPSRSQNVNPFDQGGSSARQSSSYQSEENARPIQATPVREEPIRTGGVDSYAGQSQSDTYEVRPNDNLWNIARSVRPASDLSVQQTMLALQKKNPQAFIQSNINRLKKGQVLRVPAREEIEAVSFQDAVGEVARQNRDWQARLEQLDATRRSSADAGGKGAGDDGRLSIVATDDTSGTGSDLGGGSADTATAALQNELAMTREKMDELTRENEELKSRLKDLDDQISTLKRLIDLKDDQMAALTQQPDEQAANQTPEQTDSETKPVVQPEPKPESGFLDFLFGNPLYLALVALVPLGLIAALLIYRRRKQEEDEFEEESSLEPMSLIPEESQEDDQEELELDETLEIDEDSLLEDEEPEETTQQTDDAISEADIYIAYGRFPQAAELLEKAIENEPGRADLRLKLLEVHAENNDLDNFKVALASVESLDDQGALRQADAYKARFPADAFSGDVVPEATAEESSDDLERFDLSDALTDESSADTDGELGDLEFDLDDLDFNNEPSDSAGAESADDLDFQLDDLDLEAEASDLEIAPELPDLDNVQEPAAQEVNPAAVDDLDDFLGEVGPDAEDESLGFDDGLPDLESALEDDDLDFFSDDDEAATKLDLARAYIDMGDNEGAQDILQEVLESGTDEQKQEAQILMGQAR
ncbi:FimV/HubP family polar landmark protein [Endozoicomonas sp.]|uniref:FimV/HubP family polar landmark protein n=1 Tax=Endozoicomonas sp. TaxID=1892382 RepID=UPI003D9B4DD9